MGVFVLWRAPTRQRPLRARRSTSLTSMVGAFKRSLTVLIISLGLDIVGR
jgi:hypothetical protein